MRGIVRKVAFESFSLFLLSQLLGGVHIIGGIPSIIWGGIWFAILGFLIRPILGALFTPLALITFGLSNILITIILLFILTKVTPTITITAFRLPGIHWMGFVIPAFYFNAFFAFLFVAVLYHVIQWFLIWLVQE